LPPGGDLIPPRAGDPVPGPDWWRELQRRVRAASTLRVGPGLELIESAGGRLLRALPWSRHIDIELAAHLGGGAYSWYPIAADPAGNWRRTGPVADQPAYDMRAEGNHASGQHVPARRGWRGDVRFKVNRFGGGGPGCGGRLCVWVSTCTVPPTFDVTVTRGDYSVSGETGSNGSVCFEDLPGGSDPFTVEVSRPDYVTQTREVVVNCTTKHEFFLMSCDSPATVTLTTPNGGGPLTLITGDSYYEGTILHSPSGATTQIDCDAFGAPIFGPDQVAIKYTFHRCFGLAMEFYIGGASYDRPNGWLMDGEATALKCGGCRANITLTNVSIQECPPDSVFSGNFGPYTYDPIFGWQNSGGYNMPATTIDGQGSCEGHSGFYAGSGPLDNIMLDGMFSVS
jgi:hypothetical protein